ncbi:DUF2919 family protein [Pseudidiomarina donghaiensis]|uniref:DUF2919 domain-containing protein n=1 Tax=Pseudidiomarina donghaiensis TaxID=519452 RepID=A0A432XLX4_9GAMM|nr:DUF2919 family protein [Pseudidiomarina donghaiensis]RUO49673.1 DUF2919 domain-containing protein [Pseudidiomarina donghaiensis]SFV21661.1 Protein of unknown function [Pseudidiomarina donghaiensis]
MQLQPGDEQYVTLDGALKTPLSLLFMVVFFTRGYLAWIISLTFVEDRARLLKFFYTTTEQFGLALLVGAPALMVFVLITQVKTEIAPWVSASFKVLPLLLWFSWIVDGVLLLSLISQLWPTFSFVKAVLLFGWLMVGWMLLFSRHLRRFISLVVNR